MLWTALLVFFLAGAPVFGEMSNRIVAIVDEEVITEADVAERLSAILAGTQHIDGGGAAPEQMAGMALGRLIEQRLMLQEAKRMALVISAEEIADQMEVLRRRAGSAEILRQSLIEVGLSKEQLRQQIREQLLVKRVIDVAVRSRISVSPQEVAEQLERHPGAKESGELVDVSHILVRVDDSRSEEKARKRIERIYRALEAGGAFDELARQDSDDPNAEQGGAMGWVGAGMLMPELDAAIFSLKDGAFSLPLQTRLGFHIVKVGRRRTLSSMSALEAKRVVERQLYQQKFRKVLTQWMRELKERAYIEIRTDS